jgi:hypothetical protein
MVLSTIPGIVHDTLFFSRLHTPVPERKCSNAVKDARNEASHCQVVQDCRVVHNSNSSSGGSSRDNQDAVWTERKYVGANGESDSLDYKRGLRVCGWTIC